MLMIHSFDQASRDLARVQTLDGQNTAPPSRLRETHGARPIGSDGPRKVAHLRRSAIDRSHPAGGSVVGSRCLRITAQRAPRTICTGTTHVPTASADIRTPPVGPRARCVPPARLPAERAARASACSASRCVLAPSGLPPGLAAQLRGLQQPRHVRSCPELRSVLRCACRMCSMAGGLLLGGV
jgi:hypothetical protein